MSNATVGELRRRRSWPEVAIAGLAVAGLSSTEVLVLPLRDSGPQPSRLCPLNGTNGLGRSGELRLAWASVLSPEQQ